MRLIERRGAIAATIDRAACFAESAKHRLSVFPSSAYRDSLAAVADYTVQRAR